MKIPMLFRFSLYGMLKNQRYYDPFLILAFREKGLSFLQIGILIGFREIVMNLFEVPSGAVADLYGRRRSMIFSFSAYIASFVTFALSSSLSLLFGGMFFFSLGEAFRSGTHKGDDFRLAPVRGTIGRENEGLRLHSFMVADRIGNLRADCRCVGLLSRQLHGYLLVLNHSLRPQYHQFSRLSGAIGWRSKK